MSARTAAAVVIGMLAVALGAPAAAPAAPQDWIVAFSDKRDGVGQGQHRLFRGPESSMAFQATGPDQAWVSVRGPEPDQEWELQLYAPPGRSLQPGPCTT